MLPRRNLKSWSSGAQLRSAHTSRLGRRLVLARCMSGVGAVLAVFAVLAVLAVRIVAVVAVIAVIAVVAVVPVVVVRADFVLRIGVGVLPAVCFVGGNGRVDVDGLGLRPGRPGSHPVAVGLAVLVGDQPGRRVVRIGGGPQFVRRTRLAQRVVGVWGPASMQWPLCRCAGYAFLSPSPSRSTTSCV